MSNTIQTKRGKGKPDGKLAPYELGINIEDGQLYYGGPLSLDGSSYGEAQAVKVKKAEIADTAQRIVDSNGNNQNIGTNTTPIYLENGNFKTCSGATISGTIEKAVMLAEPKEIGVNLAKNEFASFNGQQDIETGVSGVLSTNNGGTGVNTEKDFEKKILNIVYPIGSIYISINNTSPSNFIGGTWEEIKDRFLLAAGATYSAGITDGSATATLKVANLPSHSHGETSTIYGYEGWTSTKTLKQYTTAVDWSDPLYLGEQKTEAHVATVSSNANTYSTGDNEPFDIMPPYLAVYMWKRIA